MKVRVSRRFQTPEDGYGSREISIEIDSTEIQQDGVSLTPQETRDQLVVACQKTVIRYMLSQGHINIEQGQAELSRIMKIFGPKEQESGPNQE